MSARPVPEGHHTVTPYLRVVGAAKLIDFMKQAFDAAEGSRMTREDGKIQHAEVKIGDSYVWLSDAAEGARVTETMIHLYVPDVDVTFKRALAAGATSLTPPEDHYYGDRSGGVKDFAGNTWWIATHVEDVAPDEIERRAKSQRK